MPQRSKGFRFILLSLMLALVAASSGMAYQTVGSAPRASTEGLPLLRMDPILSLVPIGGAACADLRVEDVESLFGFETVIRFDPSRVNVVDAYPSTPGIQVEIGDFLKPQNPAYMYVINAADNASGSMRLAITRLSPERGVSGSGVLARICLQGINRGHTYLIFSETATLMLDPYVASLPFDLKSSGVFVGPIERHRIPFVVRGY